MAEEQKINVGFNASHGAGSICIADVAFEYARGATMRRIMRLLIAQAAVLGLCSRPVPMAARPAQPAVRTAAPCQQGPANAPTAARSNLEQSAADWGVYCEGAPTWHLQDVPRLAPGDTALRCALTGGQPYANIHCYRNLLPAAAARLTLRMTFEYSPTSTFNNQGGDSAVQALEFSLSTWQGGRRNEWALQWRNVGAQAPGWRYWNPPATPDPWVNLGITDTATLQPAGRVAHTLVLEGEIVAGYTHYLRFELDGYTQRLTHVASAALENDHADGLAVAVQLDGTAAATPYALTIDQVELTTSPLFYGFMPVAGK